MTEQDLGIQDMLDVTPFAEGKEPVAIDMPSGDEGVDGGSSGKEGAGQSSPEGSEGKQSSATAEEAIDYGVHLDAISNILNEGVEDDNLKIAFNKAVFTDKKADGTDYTIADKKSAIYGAILDRVQLGSNKEVDTFVRDLISKSFDKDFDINDYIDKGSGSGRKTIDEIVREVYTKKYGQGTDANLTDDEVEEKLNSLSEADKKLLFADYKEELRKIELDERKRAFDEQTKVFNDNVAKYNKDAEKALELFVEQAKTKDVFGGFKFGQSDKEEYLKDIPTFMKREVIKLENGDMVAMSPAEVQLAEMIKDPEAISELIPFLWMKAKGKLDSYSTLLTEKVKWDMLDRLDNSKEQSAAVAGKPDLEIKDMMVESFSQR